MTRGRFAALTPQDPRGQKQQDNFNPYRYDPDYCMQIKVMGTEGKFPEEWAAHIGVTLHTLYDWANKIPDFETAMHEAFWALRAYWSAQLRKSAMSAKPTPTALLLLVQRRFPDTYGQHNPRLTHEHFKARNDRDAEDQGKNLESQSNEEILDRLKKLEARRAEERAK